MIKREMDNMNNKPGPDLSVVGGPGTPLVLESPYCGPYGLFSGSAKSEGQCLFSRGGRYRD